MIKRYSFFIHFYFQNYTDIGKLSFSSISINNISVVISYRSPFSSCKPTFLEVVFCIFDKLKIKQKQNKNHQSYLHVLKVA